MVPHTSPKYKDSNHNSNMTELCLCTVNPVNNNNIFVVINFLLFEIETAANISLPVIGVIKEFHDEYVCYEDERVLVE